MNWEFSTEGLMWQSAVMKNERARPFIVPSQCSMLHWFAISATG